MHHDDAASHNFTPSTFIDITGKTSLESDISDKLQLFNSAQNRDCAYIQTVIGSRKVTEGYNILGVNDIYVLEMPSNVPKLL